MGFELQVNFVVLCGSIIIWCLQAKITQLKSLFTIIVIVVLNFLFSDFYNFNSVIFHSIISLHKLHMLI